MFLNEGEKEIFFIVERVLESSRERERERELEKERENAAHWNVLNEGE